MAATFFGFNLPYISNAGVLPLQADERLIKNDLLALLQTVPGQRVMRPTFGTPLNAFPFEMLTDNDLIGLRDAIIAAINTFEPRVRLTSVNVSESTVDHVLDVKIQAALTINPNKLFEIELGVSLTGGANF